MQLNTILNRVQRHRSFVYGKIRWAETATGELAIEVEIRPRANSRPVCSGCRRPGPGYDTRPPRRFGFVPLWGILVFFLYAMRRVECARCGVIVEEVPWAVGKHRMTTTYAWFLARWAKRLSWIEVARAFGTGWDTVASLGLDIPHPTLGEWTPITVELDLGADAPGADGPTNLRDALTRASSPAARDAFTSTASPGRRSSRRTAVAASIETSY